MKVIYFLIYWVLSELVLVLPIVLKDVNHKPKLKDWLPTFILAPLIFPFFMAVKRYDSPVGGYFGTGPKKKDEQKEKKDNKPK